MKKNAWILLLVGILGISIFGCSAEQGKEPEPQSVYVKIPVYVTISVEGEIVQSLELKQGDILDEAILRQYEKEGYQNTWYYNNRPISNKIRNEQGQIVIQEDCEFYLKQISLPCEYTVIPILIDGDEETEGEPVVMRGRTDQNVQGEILWQSGSISIEHYKFSSDLFTHNQRYYGQDFNVKYDGSTIIYVPFVVQTCAISLDFAQGKRVDGSTGTIFEVKCGYSFTPPEVERDGFEFVGWTPEIPEVINGNITRFTAQWRPLAGIIVGISSESDLTLSYTANVVDGRQIVNLTATSGCDAYVWRLDGKMLEETSNILSLDMTDCATGYYEVFVIAEKDGVKKSATVSVRKN